MSQQYTLVPTQEHDRHSTGKDASRVTIDDSDDDDDDITLPSTQTLAFLPSTSASAPTAQSPPSLSLTLIRQGEANRSVSCSADWSISTLKQRIYPSESADNKLIRVIYLGRVLSDEQRLSDTGIEDGHCLHVLVTDKLPSTNTATSTSHAPNTYQLNSIATAAPASPTSPYHYPQYIHTATGQALPMDSLYHAHLTSPTSPTDPTSPSPVPNTGTTKDFVVGYVLGFFLGFLACLLLWSSQSSMKQRMGIVCGMMTNIMLGGYVQKERPDISGGGVGGDGRGGLGVSHGLSGGVSASGGGVSDSVGLGGEVNGLP